MMKPFRQLPYGERFRITGESFILVRIGHNLVADWPVTLYNHRGEPIQSLSLWYHDVENGDEDGTSMDTEVEVVE